MSKTLYKLMMRTGLIVFSLLLLAPCFVFSQKKELKEVDIIHEVILKVKGTVLKDNQKVKDATATLYNNNNKIKTVVTNKDGLFTFDLDFQKDFIVEISKRGLVTQKIKFATQIPEAILKKTTTWWSFKCNINLFDMVQGLNTSALDNPVLQVQYSEKDNDFKLDEAYSKTMKAKIEEISTQSNSLKKDVYNEYLKDGDKLYGNKQYEEAWLAFKKAKDLLPKEEKASEKIQKVKKQIKVSNDEGYNKANDKAQKFEKDKNKDKAKTFYEIALLYKENDQAALSKLEELEKSGTSKQIVETTDENQELSKKDEETIVKKIDTYKKQIKVLEKENNKRSVASILDSIGNLYSQQKAHVDAIQYYGDAIKIKEETGEKKDVAKILGKSAKIYMEMGQIENTIHCYEKALKINEELKDKVEMASILDNMANIYNYTYRTDDALGAYEKLVDLKNDAGDNKGASTAYTNIGDIYLAKQNTEKAIESYNKSLKLDIELKDKKGQATNYNNLGIAFNKKGDYTKSNESHNKALNLYEELKDKSGISKTYNNIGNNHFKLKDFTKAFDYYEKALKITQELKDDKGAVSAYYNIGNLYKEQKKFDKALENYTKSIDLAQKIHYQEALGKNHKAMSGIYYEQKDYQKAYDHYKLFVDAKYIEEDEDQLAETQSKIENDLEVQKLKNKLSKQELVYKLKDEKAKKDLELRDMEIMKKDAEVKKQRNLIISFIIGFILIAIFLVLIFRQYKQIKKANRLLAQQNKEIKQQSEEITAQRDQLELQNVELEKLSIVARETDNAVIIMDGKGKFEWVNAGFQRLYGITFDQLIREKGDNFIDSSSNPDAKDLFQTCIEEKITVSYDNYTHDAKGQKIWTQTTLTPITDAAGNMIKLVAIDSNITLIKLAEQEIKLQNDEIKAQSELLHQTNKELEIKNVQIMDSINYAKRIQEAVLPRYSLINKLLPDSFILFKPKAIVSGDFYWFSQQGDQLFIAAVDCTGHGVPGAFMSMIGNTLLNEIVNNKKIFQPSQILLELNKGISFSLTQGKEGDDTQDDGMDISICRINKSKNEAILALGGHTAYLIKEEKIAPIEGDMFSIGGMFANNDRVFYTDHEIKIDSETYIYMFSDGYQDQFGGADNKKFMASRMSKLLFDNRNLSMCDQQILLDKTIEEWKGARKQLDDILVIGIKLTPEA